MISALSNFARMSAPQPRPFAVEACMREVLIQTGLPETVEVTLVGLDLLPTVAADAGQIQIVFSNLFRNAARGHVREWTLDHYWQKRWTVR